MRRIADVLAAAAGGGGAAALASALSDSISAVAIAAAAGALGGGWTWRGLLALAEGPARKPAPAPEPVAPKPAAAEGPRLPAGVGRSLLERLPIGVLILDREKQIQFMNRRAGEIVGRKVPLERHVSVIRVPDLLEAVERVAASGESVEIDFSITDRREIELHAHVMPLGPQEGAQDSGDETAQPTPDAFQRASRLGMSGGMMIVIEDHTRARRADRLHRDFIANASHELKTPLSSIIGFIETLQGHARTDEAARTRFLDIMMTQATRMKRLVDGLLSLNRIELNEHVQPREELAIFDIVREVGLALQPLAEHHSLAVLDGVDDASPRVQGDRDELAQVFVNLIENALKYSEDGTDVTVEVAAPRPGRRGMVGIAVRDSGPGIAREHIPRLTERFYRVSVPHSREKGGTGLGLAIVKHILSRHRGALDVESRTGSGSVFTVWLPELDSDARGDKAGSREHRPPPRDRAAEPSPGTSAPREKVA